MLIIKKIGVALTFLALSQSAIADVIYEQSNLLTSDRGAYQYFGQQLADDFTLTENATVDTITWQGSYYGADNLSGSESFTVQFFTSTGALPVDSAFYEFVGTATLVDSGTDLIGKTLYDYSIDVSGLSLLSGIEYWISVYSNESPTNYAWANSGDGTPDGAVYRNNGGAWQSHGGVRTNHIFTLLSNNTDVPAPGALVLLAVGLVSLGISRKRKAQ